MSERWREALDPYLVRRLLGRLEPGLVRLTLARRILGELERLGRRTSLSSEVLLRRGVRAGFERELPPIVHAAWTKPERAEAAPAAARAEQPIVAPLARAQTRVVDREVSKDLSKQLNEKVSTVVERTVDRLVHDRVDRLVHDRVDGTMESSEKLVREIVEREPSKAAGAPERAESARAPARSADVVAELERAARARVELVHHWVVALAERAPAARARATDGAGATSGPSAASGANAANGA
ncbi:MAG TPA: hypothetical protein VFF06_10680, partial [Polyangia bacterium]|nr:hypothetical protein [Polyangia bacterium]